MFERGVCILVFGFGFWSMGIQMVHTWHCGKNKGLEA